MTGFTATNGITIELTPDRDEKIYLVGRRERDGECYRLDTHATGGPEGIIALREFFQHERDAELGLWRWPAEPDWVAREATDKKLYPHRIVTVLNERTLEQTAFTRDSVTGASAKHAVARAYFTAHPEPKPWQDAKPGEAWRLREADAYPGVAILTEEMGWLWATGRAVDLTRVVDGQRIWPDNAS